MPIDSLLTLSHEMSPKPHGLKVGSIGFDTKQGLGYLAKSFRDAVVLTDFIVLAHGKRDRNPDWHPNSEYITDLRRPSSLQRIKDIMSGWDAVLFFETPFVWDLIPFCKQQGILTMLMPMHECMLDPWPALPHYILCPSDLEWDLYKRFHSEGKGGCKVVLVTVPVEDEFDFKPRGPVRRFVHNVGNGGLLGRNGTRELLDALSMVKHDMEFVIRTQTDYPLPQDLMRIPPNVRMTLEKNPERRDLLYSEGECFVFPEKFNGLSLPLQEAFASGMSVIAQNRFPINTWLPKENLVTPLGYQLASISPRFQKFETSVVDIRGLANMIDSVVAKQFDSTYNLWFRKNTRWSKQRPMYDSLMQRGVEEVRGQV